MPKTEYRITNIEGRRNVFYLFNIKIEQSETTLRYSAVHYSAVLRFAVNLEL